MSYEEESLMDTFDKWDSRDRRERFVRRMEHKLRSKELRYR
ncbi:hypothetical protein BH09PAT4_BH09PAT4_08670 [soil metagenome]